MMKSTSVSTGMGLEINNAPPEPIQLVFYLVQTSVLQQL